MSAGKNYFRIGLLTIMALATNMHALATKLLIPMDGQQTNHLRPYGIVYSAITHGNKAKWLLNYRGGSFVLEYTDAIGATCKQQGVLCTQITDAEYAVIEKEINAPAFNGDIVELLKVPKIAVYTPSGKKPWDDAVTMTLVYAGIPFDKVYVDEVLDGTLSKYDWLHLHHEDFTGQYGKFWGQFKEAEWFIADCRKAEQLASRRGFSKVSQMQLAVVKKIREFVGAGGNLFAMCSATDTYDIALAAEGTDICDSPSDGDGMAADVQSKLNFDHCFAFTNFTVSTNIYEYEYASIDNSSFRFLPEQNDYFTLLPFAAKTDPVPAMLCQSQTSTIKGFMGQTTAFRKEVLKPGVVLLAENKDVGEARYIHGKYREGSWTFYGGHDPEDYQHYVGEPPTDLANYPNSPGYRLILNNVLCVASGKKEVLPVVCCESMTETVSPFRISAGASGNTLAITVWEKSSTMPTIKEVSFVDKAGKKLLTRKYNAAKVEVAMDDLPAGAYYVMVNGTYSGRIEKN
jgi:hypothetical protein